jgi:hypothetical protein
MLEKEFLVTLTRKKERKNFITLAGYQSPTTAALHWQAQTGLEAHNLTGKP